MTKRIMAEAIVQALFNAPEAQLQDFTHPMRQRFNKLMKQPSAELQESYDAALKILKAHTIKLYDCAKCGHRWASRMDPPIRCAKCKSPYWQTPMKTQPPHDLGKLTEHQRATQGKLNTDHTRPSPGERRGKHGEKAVSDL